jgi:uncharacterized protein (TIGR03067 family)
MNKRTAVFVVFAFAFASFVHAADDPASKQDQTAMQGEWQMVSGQRGGDAMPDAMVKTGKRVFKDDQLTVTVGGMLIMKATVKLDATKTPKTIDYVVTEGPSKGKTLLGIYEFSGEKLKSCFASPEGERPTAFETKPGDGWTLSEWKRAGAPQ